MNIRRQLVAALIGLALPGEMVLALEVPYLAGRVNDLAGMLSDAAEQRVAGSLAQLESDTGAQVVVLTIASLEGEVLQDFSIRVVEAWKPGRKGVDDGVLLLIARDDRQMRIEVGYGLEGSLTDLHSTRIISEVMVPRFREGDFDGGVESATAAIVKIVRSEGSLPPASIVGSGESGSPESWEKGIAMLIFSLVIGTFSLIAPSVGGAVGWVLYFFLMPFYFAFPAALLGLRSGLFALGCWVVGFPFLRWVMPKTNFGKYFTGGGGGGSWVGGGFPGGRFPGGGFSGGGFSGGGGSFGGGGASGSW